MQRNHNPSQSSASGDPQKRPEAAMSALDREKAYEEARARIFGEEGSASPSPALSPVSSSGRLSCAGDPGQSQGQGQAEVGLKKTSSDPSLLSSSSQGAAAGTGTKSGKKPQDASKWLNSGGKRSITRDADNGKFDPDFVRNTGSSGSSGVPPAAAAAAAAMPLPVGIVPMPQTGMGGGWVGWSQLSNTAWRIRAGL